MPLEFADFIHFDPFQGRRRERYEIDLPWPEFRMLFHDG